jgi:anti-sigma regulatory factor (Ser/Thr protein kinase)
VRCGEPARSAPLAADQRACGVGPADAELVCTELVTNAIEHGGGARAVRITVDSRQVCVEVDDDEADVLPTAAHPGSGCSGAAAS